MRLQTRDRYTNGKIFVGENFFKYTAQRRNIMMAQIFSPKICSAVVLKLSGGVLRLQRLKK